MHDFFVKEIINADINNEILDVGYDKSYVHKACEKFEYKNYKIFNITSTQANIIKQLALSVGCDCATHRDCITGKAEVSDCILGGSISQLKLVSQKLSSQPFGLKILGENLLGVLDNFTHSHKNNSTKIVGILNLTKDSFSDGGDFYDYEDAINHLEELLNDGADIIDIGAESTKPGAKPISDKEQLEKIIPVLEYINTNSIKESSNILISIDTRSSVVAEECLKLGADIINDVSGFDYDDKMPDIIAKYGAKVIIQHSNGTPENMQNNTEYSNLIDELYQSLKSKINLAISKGIKKENIIIDPGIGFGKTREQNFEIIRRIEEFYGLGCPVMLGVSRKSLLNMPEETNETKDIFSVAINTLALQKHVDYIRVHNVKLHKQLLDLTSEVVL